VLLPPVGDAGIRTIFGFDDLVGEFGLDVEVNYQRGRDIDFKVLLGNDAGAVEGVVEPEVGGQGMMRSSGDNAVFEEVARSKAEDADGFYADVLIGGGIHDGGIGIVGDGARKNVDCAPAGMSDADEREVDGLEGAVEVEIEACELADAQFAVDFHAGVDFLAAVAAGFKAIAGFEKLDLGGAIRRGLVVG
jgi:hypothetical protein